MHKYKYILRYARPHRLPILLVFVLTAFAAALTALQPFPLKLLADYVVGQS